MEKKYELTNTIRLAVNEEREQGAILYQIKALKDFGDVKAGDLGGFIEKEENLSQKGSCWVYDEATVMGDALVRDSATIHNHAVVIENAEISCHASVNDDAIIRGHSLITGHAKILGHATVTKHACIAGEVTISDYVIVTEHANIAGCIQITGKKVIRSNEDFEPIDTFYMPNQLYDPSIIFKSSHPTELDIDKIGAPNITAPIKEISSNKKYELTDEYVTLCGSKLFRIKALKDFSDVKAGDLGGFIEKEVNLSHKGNCWVYNNSYITKNAIVMNDAVIKNFSMVTDDALVSGSAKIIDGSVISENAYVTDNARVSNSIVRNYAQISGNTQIYGGTIIDVGTSITNGVFLSRGHITNVEQVNRIISARTMKLPGSNMNMSDADIKALNDSILTELRDSVFRVLNKEKDEEIMSKKYELTDEELVTNNGKTVLNRIKALKDFADVKAGDLGGWIEKESNLSHEGNCWVYDGATVMDDAKICENAQIERRATIYGKAVIDGYATVSDDTTIYASAHVGGHAKVYYHASVHGNAIIAGHACIYGHANISKNTQIKGDAIITDHAYISGNVVISGNVLICGTTHITRYASITGKKIIRSNEDLIPIYKSSTPHINKLLSAIRDYNQSINFKSLYPNEFTIGDEGEIPGTISKFIKEMNVNKKYELTERTKLYDNGHIELHRIKALKDFGNVKKGDLGGWIEKEENLSQEGNCWVYNEAIVMNNATVTDDAKVMRNAIVAENASLRNYSIAGINAKIVGNTCISGRATVMDNALVGGYAVVSSNAIIRDKAQIKGHATILDAVIKNDVIVDGCYKIDDCAVVTNAAQLPMFLKLVNHVTTSYDIISIDCALTAKKYELTKEVKTINNGTVVVHRIKALKDFGNVKKGDLGGWIEKEENLSQEGDCWVYRDAIVCNDATVTDDAIITDHAWIFGYAKIKDRACISGHAEVKSKALVCGDASIRHRAVVGGDAIIKNIAVVYGSARIFGVATIKDHACIFGHAEVMGDALVCNHASICDYARVTGKATVSDYATIRDRAVVTGSAKIIGVSVILDNACVKGNATILDAVIKNDMIVDEHSKIDGDTVIDNTTRLIKASSNNKKYELTDITKVLNDGKTVVHRIKALRDFSDVKKGDLGGFIEGEFNLSHKGNCWAYDGVIVCGRAGLYDNDIIRNTADNGNMTIFDYRKILGPL